MLISKLFLIDFYFAMHGLVFSLKEAQTKANIFFLKFKINFLRQKSVNPLGRAVVLNRHAGSDWRANETQRREQRASERRAVEPRVIEPVHRHNYSKRKRERENRIAAEEEQIRIKAASKSAAHALLGSLSVLR